MLCFSIVVPVYNESKNIINLINEIYDQDLQNYNFETIFVDDRSTDTSLSILKSIDKNNFRYIVNKKNLGQSQSIYNGIKVAKYDTIVTLDGDGQNDPKDILILLKYFFKSDELKLIGGIRKKRKDNYVKIFSSKIANFIRQIILKDDCDDTGCSLKIFSKKIFLNFPYFNGMHRFLPALFKGYGHKTMFLDVNHRKRNFGSSKYGTIDRLFKGIIDIIKVSNIIKNKK